VKTFSAVLGRTGRGYLRHVVGSIVGHRRLGVSILPPTLPLTAAGLDAHGNRSQSNCWGDQTIWRSWTSSRWSRDSEHDRGHRRYRPGRILIPPTIALSAAGLLIVGQAMVIVAGAIAILGNLSIDPGQGAYRLGATLVVLAGGLTLMAGTLPGLPLCWRLPLRLAILAPVAGRSRNVEVVDHIQGAGRDRLGSGLHWLWWARWRLRAACRSGCSSAAVGWVFVLTAGAVFIFAKALTLLGSNGRKGYRRYGGGDNRVRRAYSDSGHRSFVKGLVSIADQIGARAEDHLGPRRDSHHDHRFHHR
jgi:hypothetical protein